MGASTMTGRSVAQSWHQGQVASAHRRWHIERRRLHQDMGELTCTTAPSITDLGFLFSWHLKNKIVALYSLRSEI
jgi:hypothetical protein